MILLFPNVSSASTQGSCSWCAGYSAAAIMSYLGIKTTAKNIADAYGLSCDQGIADTKIINYAQRHGLYPIYSSALTFTQYKEQINRNQPVYLGMRSQRGDHAIVLRGYSYGMSSVWNPWYNFYETTDSLTHYVPTHHQTIVYSNFDCIYNWQN